MPVKTCTTRDLNAVVAEIEDRGDRLVGIAAANEDTVFVAYYSPKVNLPKGRETR